MGKLGDRGIRPLGGYPPTFGHCGEMYP
jgi:hypothetical protein